MPFTSYNEELYSLYICFPYKSKHHSLHEVSTSLVILPNRTLADASPAISLWRPARFVSAAIPTSTPLPTISTPPSLPIPISVSVPIPV